MSACRMIDRGGRAVMTITIFAAGAGVATVLIFFVVGMVRLASVKEPERVTA